MDQFNVIEPTTDLDKLQTDMYNWSLLPFEFRMRSNEECLRKYNMTNTDLFNKIKTSIIDKSIPKTSGELSTSVSEGSIELTDKNIIPELHFSDEEYQQYIWKKEMAKQLEISPNVVIISPFNDNEKEYTLDKLEFKYQKYQLLNQRHKLFSNSYSINLWNYDVPNMYAIMKKKIMSMDGIEPEIYATLGESKYEKLINPLKNVVNEALVSGDILTLMNIKLDSCSSMGIYPKIIYKKIIDNINESYNDFGAVIPKVVPYFTLDEMTKMGLYNNIASNFTMSDYYNTLVQEMKQYENSPSENSKQILEKEILSLGWNPSVPITEKSLNFARDKQIKWLKEHSCRVIDITKLKTKSILNESSLYMRKTYREKDLYPVYIILSFTNTAFGKVIRKVKNCTYTHAGICLDSDLKKIMTFKFGMEWNGFSEESIDFYLKRTINAELEVLCIFVNEETRNRIESSFNKYNSEKDKTKYGFGNIFNILFNKAKPNDPESLSLVCSQFVDTILKLSNINLFDKPSNLVIPQDFALCKNPKVFKLFSGYARDYIDNKIESNIETLFSMNNDSKIRYESAELLASQYFIEGYYSDTENKYANKVLKEIRELLTPEPVIIKTV